MNLSSPQRHYEIHRQYLVAEDFVGESVHGPRVSPAGSAACASSGPQRTWRQAPAELQLGSLLGFHARHAERSGARKYFATVLRSFRSCGGLQAGSLQAGDLQAGSLQAGGLQA